MIIGYLRVSTEKQNLCNQKEEISKFAVEKQFVIDKWVMVVRSGNFGASNASSFINVSSERWGKLF